MANDVPNPAMPPQETLPPTIGGRAALAVVVGAIIGSGIFLKPGVAARELPYPGLILLVWIAVGLITLCGSLTLAELAAMLPRAGGPYVYLREAYGRLPAFLWGWTEFWVIRTGSLGALAVATSIYLSQLAPLDRTGQEVVTIAILAFLTAVNIAGTRYGAQVQNATTILKVGFLVFLILLPFARNFVEWGHFEPFAPAEWTGTVWRGLAVAMISVMWPYDGWIAIAPVAEEIRNPQRNVPLALALGVGIVMLLYVSANVSYLLVLSVEEIAHSEAVASKMCEKLFGSLGGSLVAAGVMTSTFGAVNANVLCGPRIYFAMARDGLLPPALARVHDRFETPANAILLQGVWSILLVLLAFTWRGRPSEAFDTLTEFVIFGGSIFYAMAVAAVFVLRRRRPDWPRPYRTFGYPVVPLIYLAAFGATLAALFFTRPVPSLIGGVLILLGAVAYRFAAKRGERGRA